MSVSLSANAMVAPFLPGDLVEVRSVAEILATLEANGTLENLPFMPEMLAYCGRQFRVASNAFKTCVDDGEMRQLKDTVFLEEARCDGSSHNGCARSCLIFWKTAWLKRAGENSENRKPAQRVSESQLLALANRDGKFFCQATEIINASQPLPWWHTKQYIQDLKYNRVPLRVFALSLFIAVYNKVAARLKVRSWGLVVGSQPSSNGHKQLNLQPGELVRVKPLHHIKATLDHEGKHQKLLFAPAMANFCGQVMRVRDRVETIVLDASPRERKLTDTVLLEGATCDGVCHRMCPRQSLLFWRECWLERVSAN